MPVTHEPDANGHAVAFAEPTTNTSPTTGKGTAADGANRTGDAHQPATASRHNTQRVPDNAAAATTRNGAET